MSGAQDPGQLDLMGLRTTNSLSASAAKGHEPALPGEGAAPSCWEPPGGHLGPEPPLPTSLCPLPGCLQVRVHPLPGPKSETRKRLLMRL